MENNIPELKGFNQAAQQFISSIYEAEQDFLKADDNNKTFRQNIASKFIPKIKVNKPIERVESLRKNK